MTITTDFYMYKMPRGKILGSMYSLSEIYYKMNYGVIGMQTTTTVIRLNGYGD